MFDPEIVERLRLSLSQKDLLELLAFLPEEARRVLAELAHARHTGDLSDVMVATHGLRGVAGNFGAVRLEAISRAMNNKQATLEDLENLAHYLERCIKDLDAELN